MLNECIGPQTHLSGLSQFFHEIEGSIYDYYIAVWRFGFPESMVDTAIFCIILFHK